MNSNDTPVSVVAPPVCAAHMALSAQVESNNKLIQQFALELSKMKWILVIIAGETAMKLLGWG